MDDFTRRRPRLPVGLRLVVYIVGYCGRLREVEVWEVWEVWRRGRLCPRSRLTWVQPFNLRVLLSMASCTFDHTGLLSGTAIKSKVVSRLWSTRHARGSVREPMGFLHFKVLACVPVSLCACDASLTSNHRHPSYLISHISSHSSSMFNTTYLLHR